MGGPIAQSRLNLFSINTTTTTEKWSWLILLMMANVVSTFINTPTMHPTRKTDLYKVCMG